MTDLTTPPATTCRSTRSWEHRGIRVIECEACGYRHQDPLPTPDEVASLYAAQYYEEVKPDYHAIVERDRAQIELWSDLKRRVADRLLDERRIAVDRPRRVLDIGSSFGQFLLPFARAGWRSVGVEPANGPAEVAAGHDELEIHHGMFEAFDAATLGGPFEVVHLGGVLNHLLDPVSTFERIRDELLVPGGVVIVETSNDFNALQETIVAGRGHDRWWVVPDHVTYFDHRSLGELLERLDLPVRQVMGTFPMELFPLLGWDYLADGDVGPDCHRRRVAFEELVASAAGPEVLERLYTALGSAGFGRAVLLFAQVDP